MEGKSFEEVASLLYKKFPKIFRDVISYNNLVKRVRGRVKQGSHSWDYFLSTYAIESTLEEIAAKVEELVAIEKAFAAAARKKPVVPTKSGPTGPTSPMEIWERKKVGRS